MTSYILYDGPSLIDGGPILALAASVDQPSKNSKTGPMVQVYFLRKDVTPWEGIRSGVDASICGTCIHRPKLEGGKHRSCYVDLRFVNPVWFARRAEPEPGMFEGRAVRVGAYGDPLSTPIEALAQVFFEAEMWTGYTQFWRTSPDAEKWRGHLMASVHTAEEAQIAQSMGWRTYRSRFPFESLISGEIDCPFYAAGVQCIDCNLCDGHKSARESLNARERGKPDTRKNISSLIHGPGQRYFQRSAAAQRSLPL